MVSHAACTMLTFWASDSSSSSKLLVRFSWMPTDPYAPVLTVLIPLHVKSCRIKFDLSCTEGLLQILWIFMSMMGVALTVASTVWGGKLICSYYFFSCTCDALLNNYVIINVVILPSGEFYHFLLRLYNIKLAELSMWLIIAISQWNQLEKWFGYIKLLISWAHSFFCAATQHWRRNGNASVRIIAFECGCKSIIRWLVGCADLLTHAYTSLLAHFFTINLQLLVSPRAN